MTTKRSTLPYKSFAEWSAAPLEKAEKRISDLEAKLARAREILAPILDVNPWDPRVVKGVFATGEPGHVAVHDIQILVREALAALTDTPPTD